MRPKTAQLDIDPVRPTTLAGPFPVRPDQKPLRPSRQARATDTGVPTSSTSAPLADFTGPSGAHGPKAPVVGSSMGQLESSTAHRSTVEKWKLKRGHTLTYAGLFLFTAILYARPSEFYPSPVTASIALVVGIITLAFFGTTQLSLEGTLTANVREVNLVVLFTLLALLSIPLAMSPSEAWQVFSGTFIRCIVIFIVLVNVVRTEARLKGLLFLGLVAAIWLSVGAINDYRLGLLTVEGYRVDGRGTGLFGNTIDMALYLVTMLPIAVAFLLGARNKIVKIIWGVCAAAMLAAIVVTYSRGAFLGLIGVIIFMVMKLGRRNRLAITLSILLMGIGFLFLAPGNYGVRILSIFDPSLDPVGSATARRGELFRSLYVAIRHPLLGIGIDNYKNQMSLRGLVTHNSYTQVAAEMGLAALVIYTLFIVSPLRKLGQITRETLGGRSDSRFYYMAVGLQASLIAYMISSFFVSVPYLWYVYYLVGYAVCLRRIYESETGRPVVVVKRKERQRDQIRSSTFTNNSESVPA